jgi:hypothetical protein
LTENKSNNKKMGIAFVIGMAAGTLLYKIIMAFLNG